MTTLQVQLQPTADQGGRVKVVAGYALQQRLGSGSFATVYKGVKVQSSEAGESSTTTEALTDVVAIKAINRTSEKLTKKVLDNLEQEISILRTYKHRNIVCMTDVVKTDRHYYLILEYCGGGDVQRLIRTRKAGRLSERLARRLMRDLAAGLKFLWNQELIHRDIKPQNLLLTGPLPLDEVNDPATLDVHDEMRQAAEFPSELFALKIADFGFARHLQSASLAETLCGSPLYMAPEILQHQRYDAKADLWSVGTVLFEMVTGKTPFNGENHIDLLRNIQRRAVRLSPDVRVSKECVALLRQLLNRNPLSRAGFQEFFAACDAFVALGCEGIATLEDGGSSHRPSIKTDLGTIPEDQGNGSGSIMTVATEIPEQGSVRALAAAPPRDPVISAQPPAFVTPPLGPVPSPTTAVVNSPFPGGIRTSEQRQPVRAKFAPLQPSPPHSGLQFSPSKVLPPSIPNLAMVEPRSVVGQIQLTTFQSSRPSSCETSAVTSQNSSDDSEFVMVEHGTGTSSPSTSAHQRRSSPSSPRYSRQGSGNLLTVNDGSRGGTKGILSTSPGTGGMLVALMGGSRRLLHMSPGSHPSATLESQIETACKMIAASEDVGRRSITVAHVGDTRAYMAMRTLVGGDSSLLQSAVEETDCDEGSSNLTEVAGQARRRTVSSDRSMLDAKEEEDRSMPDMKEEDDDEMPFAMPVEEPQSRRQPPPFAPIPSRLRTESIYKKTVVLSEPKFSLQMIRKHFSDALSCYLKALAMIRSVLGALQKVKKDLDTALGQISRSSGEQAKRVEALIKRCDTTTRWLSGQFTGVLERADAANQEIQKLSAQSTSEQTDGLPVTNVKELIYNHCLACAREAAVKELLGQFDAARSCYRSAGLLAETLLMEADMVHDDKKILEESVDRFSSKINELDSRSKRSK